jgi:exodeoxyribonuclease VII small subunit
MQDELEKLTFEQTVDQLEQLVKKLESGQISLEDQVVAYERGAKLADHAKQLLDKQENKITVLMENGREEKLVTKGATEEEGTSS